MIKTGKKIVSSCAINNRDVGIFDQNPFSNLSNTVSMVSNYPIRFRYVCGGSDRGFISGSGVYVHYTRVQGFTYKVDASSNYYYLLIDKWTGMSYMIKKNCYSGSPVYTTPVDSNPLPFKFGSYQMMTPQGIFFSSLQDGNTLMVYNMHTLKSMEWDLKDMMSTQSELLKFN